VPALARGASAPPSTLRSSVAVRDPKAVAPFRGAERRRGLGGLGRAKAEVIDDFGDGDLVVQVGDDRELAPTLRAREGIDVEDRRDEPCPACAAAALLGRLLLDRGLARFGSGAGGAGAMGQYRPVSLVFAFRGASARLRWPARGTSPRPARKRSSPRDSTCRRDRTQERRSDGRCEARAASGVRLCAATGLVKLMSCRCGHLTLARYGT